MKRQNIPLSFMVVTSLMLIFTMAFTRPAAAQAPGNDPWSWCDYHPYSQPFDEEVCEEPPVYSVTPVVQDQQLRHLLEQHMLLSAYMLMAQMDKRADETNWQQALDQNTQQLGNVVQVSYGDNARKGFINLWQQHISLLSQYADGVKNGENNRSGLAAAQLNDNVGYMASMFQNQQHPKQDLQLLFQQHLNDEKSIVDNYALGNQAAVSDLLGQSTIHADMIADAIAGPDGGLAPTLAPGQ